MRRLLLCSGVCAVGFTALAGLAGAGASIVRGETGADTTCMVGDDFVAIQIAVSGGTPYTVPRGGYRTVASWSAADGVGGQEALVMVRPTGVTNEYRVIGSSAPGTLSDPLNTFKAGKFRVKEGDLIGFWVQDETVCARVTGSGDDVVGLFAPSGVPTAGTVMTVFPITGYRLNMSVTLLSPPPGR